MLLVWYCIAETRKWQKNHGKHICQGTTLKECNLERKKKELVVLREDIERPGDSIGEGKVEPKGEEIQGPCNDEGEDGMGRERMGTNQGGKPKGLPEGGRHRGRPEDDING